MSKNSGLYEMFLDELNKLLCDVLAEIKTRQYHEGYKQGKFDAKMEGISETTPPIPFTHPQDIRDEIIEQAKHDVVELKDERGGYRILSRSGNGKASCELEFIVNKEKRTVVALLRGFRTKWIRAKGISKATPSDCFNAHIGKAIALRRALGLEVPAEFLNAPQPTEVRVGDVVEYAGYKVTVMPTGRVYDYTLGTCAVGSFVSESGNIIDDSREEVSE